MAELWKQLHTRALNFKGKDDSVFLNNFMKKIPRYTKGCKCKEHWVIFIKQNPPNYNDYFAWSVKAHNHINKLTNKPVYTVEQAKKFYSK